MSAQKLEEFLVRVYVDEQTRARFRADPRGESMKAGLTDDECTALAKIDLIGLELAADSFARKRSGSSTAHPISNLLRRLRR